MHEKKISYQELIENFEFLLHIARSELGNNRYREDVEFYILSLVFYKRYVDYNLNFKEGNLSGSWRKIRNLAVHTGFGGIADVLDDSFYYLEKNDPLLHNIFCGITFKNCDFISSIFAIILHLDRLNLSEENVSANIMGRAFDYLVNLLFGEKKGNDITNPELRSLMINLINPTRNDKIYDPFVGGGSLLIEAYNYPNNKNSDNELNIELYGEEVSSKLFCICRMNLIISGITYAKLSLGDVILSPGFVDERELLTFDKIYTQIPLSTRNDNYYYEVYRDKYDRFNYGRPPRHTFDFGFIQHIISSLNNRGQASIIVSKKMLASEGSEALVRKSIIEFDLIDSIIFLPEEYNMNKQEMAILIIDKNKPQDRKGKILFINTKIYKNKINSKNKLDIKRIENIYKAYLGIEGISKVVDLEEMSQNKFNLDFNRYDSIFLENELMLNNGEGRKLRDVVSVLNEIPIRNTEDDDEGFPYIRIRDLNFSIEEKILFTEGLEKKNLLINKEILSQRALIIALLGEKLKVTIFDPEYGPEKVILGQNTFALIPNEELIDLEYLYYQLYSPRVLKQLEYLRIGIIPRIRKNDFLDIVVPVPDLIDQFDYIRIQKQSLVELDTLRTNDQLQKLEMKNVAYNVKKDVIGILSHNTLPYITNMQFALNSLSRYLVRKNLIDEFVDDVESFTHEDLLFIDKGSFKQETIKQVIERANKYLKSFEDIIVKTKETVQLELERDDFEEINISEIFMEIVELKKNECQDRYEIIVDCPNLFIEIHRISFKELIIQLLRNAEMHAFDFMNKSNKYFVKFKVFERGENMIVTYSNNGKLFELSQEDFISPLKKSQGSIGNGLGGSYIHKVVVAHNGEIDIVNKSKGMEMNIIIPKKVGDIE
ncbi:hypothetical protein PMSD_15585 [Paenibacillus macquariensis subsp. defensor]|nr:hypothetical protein PMSD_15585 [Paenibacillus macquariensis subsp. defensor]